MKDFIGAARGDIKVDLVLKNCRIVNVFTSEIEENNIAIYKGKIVGIGDYKGRKEVDIAGKFVCPGLIDAHVHIESSMLTPPKFSEVVLAKGTTTIVADPHEIGNVCGIDGIKYMINASKEVPLDVYYMLPSCVPSTSFENSGAVLNAEELTVLKNLEQVLGLGEMMNYPGVIQCNDEVLKKLEAFQGQVIDGHAPGVNNKALNAYIMSGIKTDHECTTVEELKEKVKRGMYVHIREGSATRNLNTLIRGVNAQNSRRLLFCTDDKHPSDLRKEGHIDNNVRLAIRNGVNPITAIQMATINSAECYGLKHIGAIAPAYQADLIIFDNFENFNINKVYKKGELVAIDGRPTFESSNYRDDRVLNTVRIKNRDNINLDIKLETDFTKVIRLVEHNIITQKVVRKVDVKEGIFVHNDKLDLLKLAVIERHKMTGNVGLGLVEGYGFKNGAVALSIAHDSHNIIVIGDNDADMKLAIQELEKNTGGITICEQGKVLHTLRLEVAGLMTNSPIEEVEKDIEKLVKIANGKGVVSGIDPFLTLAFLGLPVIPELKLTDKGLFDVTKFSFTGIEA